jgi:hypothetical protein
VEPPVERLDPVDEAAPPTPSSAISMTARPFTRAMLTATEDASAYFAMLVRASETT